MSHSSLCFPCALALELRPGTLAGRRVLAPAEAGALAQAVAHDLAALVPEASSLDLGLVAALFDPVELLRPGYPVHAEIERWMARAPGSTGGRVLGFGAETGTLPAPLQPASEHAHGPLRLLPLLLRGSASTVASAGDQLERVLLDAGMVAAGTALQAQEAFGLSVEHARLLTLNDLAAMMCLQYEHAGLAPLWPLLEAALMAPSEVQWLDAPPEPLLRYSGGEVRMALLDIEAWVEHGFAPAGASLDQLGRAFDHFQARLRQFAALLEAHGVGVVYDHCPSGRDPRKILAD